MLSYFWVEKRASKFDRDFDRCSSLIRVSIDIRIRLIGNRSTWVHIRYTDAATVNVCVSVCVRAHLAVHEHPDRYFWECYHRRTTITFSPTSVLLNFLNIMTTILHWLFKKKELLRHLISILKQSFSFFFSLRFQWHF